MHERVTTVTPFAVVAAADGVLGVCCGLPVLFSLGVAGAVAGLSVSSWALIGLGLALAVLGGPGGCGPDDAPPPRLAQRPLHTSELRA